MAAKGPRWWGRVLCAAWVIASAPASTAEARPGDLDPSFGAGGKVTTVVDDWTWTFVTQLMRDGQGRIVGGGTGGQGAFLIRYRADGALDTTFGTNGITVDPRFDWTLPPPFAIAADGRIYAGGYTWEDHASLLLRYDADGHPDPSFGTDGILPIGFAAREIVPLPDGRLLVTGACDGVGASGAIRILPDGALDPTFTVHHGSCGEDGFRTLGMPTADTIVLAGLDWNLPHRVFLGHLLANGDPDPAYAPQPYRTSPPLPFRPVLVRVQPDGKAVAVDEGEFGTINLVRVNGDGSLDTSFGDDGFVTLTMGWDYGSWVGALAVQRNGRILVAGVGASPTIAGDADVYVLRLLPDGTLDAGFGDGGVVLTDVGSDLSYEYQEIAYALLEYADGGDERILAGGASHDGAERGPVAVLRYFGGVCGDGTLAAGEACDAGAANGTPSTCCASDCTFKVDGTACASGDECRVSETCVAGDCVGSPVVCPTCTSCESASGCVFTPRTDCARAATPARAALDLRRGAAPRGHRLAFQWKADGPLAASALADPTTESGYALCLYDRAEGTPELRFAAAAPAGGTCGNRSCWRRKGDRFVYRNGAADPDGITRIEADASLGKIRVLGKGAHLALPSVPLATPATAELRVEGGGCWQLDADATTIRQNDGARFRATVP